MAGIAVRTRVMAAAFAVVGTATMTGMSVPAAHADSVAYLVNVTVRPGYNFASPQAALDYGHGVCAKVRQDRSYSAVMADIERDFHTTDEYQASYLIIQAVNELCPELIWQLRNSAANHVPTGA